MLIPMVTIQVQLPDKVVIYEIDSDDPNDMMYHQKVRSLFYTKVIASASHLLLSSITH